MARTKNAAPGKIEKEFFHAAWPGSLLQRFATTDEVAALVTMSGDINFDGTARPQRFGLMTLVVEKRDGAWQIAVAQNTNALLGTPPELKDIKTPISIPGTEVKP